MSVVAEFIAAVDEGEAEPTYPIWTWVGIKYNETRHDTTGCLGCPYYAECSNDVFLRDGFAWCEALLPVDIEIDYQTANRRSNPEEVVLL